ncbi:hypothetical protein L7F22_055479 [Adiantum nelumboides]|nr:hypothetical protein [Adiantum nelumboides]
MVRMARLKRDGEEESEEGRRLSDGVGLGGGRSRRTGTAGRGGGSWQKAIGGLGPEEQAAGGRLSSEGSGSFSEGFLFSCELLSLDICMLIGWIPDVCWILPSAVSLSGLIEQSLIYNCYNCQYLRHGSFGTLMLGASSGQELANYSLLLFSAPASQMRLF